MIMIFVSFVPRDFKIDPAPLKTCMICEELTQNAMSIPQ